MPDPEDETVVIEASDEAVAGIAESLRTGRFDFTVTAARIAGAGTNDQGPWVEIAWETVSAGFGSLTFFTQDGKLRMDTEAMSRDFVREVLLKLIDVAVED